jgi:hypothetical protein
MLSSVGDTLLPTKYGTDHMDVITSHRYEIRNVANLGASLTQSIKNNSSRSIYLHIAMVPLNQITAGLFIIFN